MKRRGWMALAAAVFVLPLLLTACGGSAAEEDATPPAVTEQVKGTDIIRVKLTAEAAERIGVKTVKVGSTSAGVVIPYDAVLYDPDGNAWTYTNRRPLVFQRQDVTVAAVHGDRAILSKGPAVGTPVVTTGATEIWGVEYGGIEED
jgi:hypothetical protein